MQDEHGVIVVVEDDPNIADLVDLYLRREGFRVLLAADGRTGLEIARRERARLVVLDIGLPGELDGLDVCRALRADGDVAVIMLTARDDTVDRVLGLELGADDYMSKPFSPRELVARVKAVLRHGERARDSGQPATIAVGGLEVELARREVRVGGVPVALTQREFDLLAHLVANRGIVLSRQQLLDAVWGPGWYGDQRTVDVHVRQLRKKLGDELPLTTIWGVGYRCD